MQLARDISIFKELVSTTTQKQKEGNMFLNGFSMQITKSQGFQFRV